MSSGHKVQATSAHGASTEGDRASVSTPASSPVVAPSQTGTAMPRAHLLESTPIDDALGQDIADLLATMHAQVHAVWVSAMSAAVENIIHKYPGLADRLSLNPLHPANPFEWNESPSVNAPPNIVVQPSASHARPTNEQS